VHHLDSGIKRDQLDVTCFFISLFNAQHVSDVNTSILRSLQLICWVISWVVKRDQFDVTCFFISLFNAQHVSDVNTSIIRSLRLICWVISWVVKRDQLDVTCFFISLFNAQNVSDVNTSTLRSLRLICWVISWVVLLCKDRALAYLFSGECLVVTCVVVIESVFLQILAAAVSYDYWVFCVCSVFFNDVSWIYSDVVYMNLHIPGTMRVGVTLWFGWGGVVSGCSLKHYWDVNVECWALNKEIKKSKWHQVGLSLFNFSAHNVGCRRKTRWKFADVNQTCFISILIL
jgi:hypothetical protein